VVRAGVRGSGEGNSAPPDVASRRSCPSPWCRQPSRTSRLRPRPCQAHGHCAAAAGTRDAPNWGGRVAPSALARHVREPRFHAMEPRRQGPRLDIARERRPPERPPLGGGRRAMAVRGAAPLWRINPSPTIGLRRMARSCGGFPSGASPRSLHARPRRARPGDRAEVALLAPGKERKPLRLELCMAITLPWADGAATARARGGSRTSPSRPRTPSRSPTLVSGDRERGAVRSKSKSVPPWRVSRAPAAVRMRHQRRRAGGP
jgi:hypothetical protein